MQCCVAQCNAVTWWYSVKGFFKEGVSRILPLGLTREWVIEWSTQPCGPDLQGETIPQETWAKVFFTNGKPPSLYQNIYTLIRGPCPSSWNVVCAKWPVTAWGTSCEGIYWHNGWISSLESADLQPNSIVWSTYYLELIFYISNSIAFCCFCFKLFCTGIA